MATEALDRWPGTEFCSRVGADARPRANRAPSGARSSARVPYASEHAEPHSLRKLLEVVILVGSEPDLPGSPGQHRRNPCGAVRPRYGALGCPPHGRLPITQGHGRSLGRATQHSHLLLHSGLSRRSKSAGHRRGRRNENHRPQHCQGNGHPIHDQPQRENLPADQELRHSSV
jgi:hypothetical protein